MCGKWAEFVVQEMPEENSQTNIRVCDVHLANAVRNLFHSYDFPTVEVLSPKGPSYECEGQ